jgi:serine/threonine protein phosphatase PrpC
LERAWPFAGRHHGTTLDCSVKKCPKCGASATDDDAFCEADGAKLVGGASSETSTTACSSCGLADADEGDGYCSACGHRLAASAANGHVVLGAVLDTGAGRLTVLAIREPDVFVARSDDGVDYLVAFGTAEEIAQEEVALKQLSGDRAFPRVSAFATAGANGSFLVLSQVPSDAKPIMEVGPGMAPEAGLALALCALDLAASIESERLGWEPRTSDIFLRPDGTLTLARLRRAAALADGARLDARRVLDAVGEALLPFPLVHASSSLLKQFCRPQASMATPWLTVEEARRSLGMPDPAPTEALPGLAELCDRGLKRDHNEDATAMAAGGKGDDAWSVLVVCDGVSSSTHAEEASTIAAETTRDILAHFARSGDIAFEGAASAMKSAIRAAHVAVCASRIEHGDRTPPGSTIVAALVYKQRLTVGWVGDSRAYWVSPSGSELLTRDHSWVNETVARGEMSESEAMVAPLAHALTKCLGPLEVGDGKIFEIDPDIRVRQLPGPGHVVLCSDGLWNYFPAASDIALLVQSAGAGANTAVVARILVNHALAKGGGDNVSVAVCAYTSHS